MLREANVYPPISERPLLFENARRRMEKMGVFDLVDRIAPSLPDKTSIQATRVFNGGVECRIRIIMPDRRDPNINRVLQIATDDIQKDMTDGVSITAYERSLEGGADSLQGPITARDRESLLVAIFLGLSMIITSDDERKKQIAEALSLPPTP